MWALVEAHFADGGDQRYQVFIGGRGRRPSPEFLEGKEQRAARPTCAADDGERGALRRPRRPRPRHRRPPPRRTRHRGARCGARSCSSTRTARSSSTRPRILKVFRKIEPGPNPDVEITRVLAEQGYAHVLAAAGRAAPRRHRPRRRSASTSSGPPRGGQLARTSVRDLLASRLPPEECGGDFAPDVDAPRRDHRRAAPRHGRRLGRGTRRPAAWVDADGGPPRRVARGGADRRRARRRRPRRGARPVPAPPRPRLTAAGRSASTATSTWPR